jgi:hypothetical protein
MVAVHAFSRHIHVSVSPPVATDIDPAGWSTKMLRLIGLNKNVYSAGGQTRLSLRRSCHDIQRRKFVQFIARRA